MLALPADYNVKTRLELSLGRACKYRLVVVSEEYPKAAWTR